MTCGKIFNDFLFVVVDTFLKNNNQMKIFILNVDIQIHILK